MLETIPVQIPELFSTGTLLFDSGTANLPQLPTVRQMVAQNPRRARIFEKYGISYCCCSGNKTFLDACADLDIDPNRVLGELSRADDHASSGTTRTREEWGSDRVEDLRRHIIEVHHAYLLTELPRISYLVERVVNRHGGLHEHLLDLQLLFEEFKAGMESHIQKEEEDFFSLLARFEEQAEEEQSALKGALRKTACDLEVEHRELARVTAELSILTDGFNVPRTACNTFRVMLTSLRELIEEVEFYTAQETRLLFAVCA